MRDRKIEILITKYCTNHITIEELQELNKWISEGKNEHFFQEYISLNFSVEELKRHNDFNKDLVWNSINKSIKPAKSTTLYWKYAVAATIAILLSIPFFFKEEPTPPIQSVTTSNKIKIGTDKAVLTLENGTDIVLQKGETYTTNNLSSNGEKLVYNTAPTKEIAYNYLTIPRGGEYFIELSDGTQVWLNSETKLKYPVSFIEGTTREVELVYGEAYFDVSPSEEHNGSNFIVNHTKQRIDVLGTEFNIKAYKDETIIYTTLVEGKVNVSNNTKNNTLVPNQQAILNSGDDTFTVNHIDVLTEIAWIKGDFVFHRKPLEQITKVLTRWYDIDIVIQNETLKNIEFTGELSKYQNLEDILILIKNTKYINDYEINKNTILIY